MIDPMRLQTLILATSLLCTSGIAQHLRRGIFDADLVVIAQRFESKVTADGLIRHRLEVLDTLKGEETTTIAIIGSSKVADLPQPSSSGPRLYCLRKDSRRELAQGPDPIYRMLGYQGANPRVDRSDARDPNLVLVKILIASEDGASPKSTCDSLFDLAMTSVLSPESASAQWALMRIEAVQTLRERQMLSGKLSPFQMSNLLSLAVAETEDIPFKISLASLCAEKRMKGVIEALCISLDHVGDKRFTTALGRMARVIHPDSAAELLLNELLKARSKAKRNRLLHALGATQTQDALQALMRYRKINGPGAAIDAALRAHGSKQAMAIVEASEKGK